MGDHSPSQAEVDRNFEEFKRMLPELMMSAPGKYVVMHDGAVAELFDTFADAARYGYAKFGRDRFSVQEVTGDFITAGCHSYAFRPYSA